MSECPRIEVSLKVYPLEAVYAAAYAFIDRAFVHLSEKSAHVVRVELEPKEDAPLAAEAARRLAGEFRNELLHHALRLKVSSTNQKIREYIVTRALLSAQPLPEPAQNGPGPDGYPVTQPAPAAGAAPAGPALAEGKAPGSAAPAPGGPSPEDDALAKEIQKLLAEIDRTDGQEDPLGIVAPWEETHAKEQAAPAEDAAKEPAVSKRGKK